MSIIPFYFLFFSIFPSFFPLFLFYLSLSTLYPHHTFTGTLRAAPLHSDGCVASLRSMPLGLLQPLPAPDIQGLWQNRKWVSDIQGALTVQVLVKYLQFWNLLDRLELQQDMPDQHSWRLSKHGCYSSKSAYEVFFIGTIKFGPWKRTWKTWAQLKCRFLYGWQLRIDVGRLIDLQREDYPTLVLVLFGIRLWRLSNTV